MSNFIGAIIVLALGVVLTLLLNYIPIHANWYSDIKPYVVVVLLAVAIFFIPFKV